MIDPLVSAIKSAGSGLQAQSKRMQILSENIANANSTPSAPGEDPYQRKTITFESILDETSGADTVKVAEIGRYKSPYRIEHDPGHPAADEKGNVMLPNVDILVELADMREANRSYSANIQVIKQTRELLSMMVDLLRATS